MTKVKKKTVEAKKPIAGPRTRAPKPRGADPEILGRREFWQDQIDRLVGQEFPSIDAAIDAIVEEVLNVVAPGEKHSAEEREMLHTLLATDADFSDDLRKILKIRRSN